MQMYLIFFLEGHYFLDIQYNNSIERWLFNVFYYHPILLGLKTLIFKKFGGKNSNLAKFYSRYCGQLLQFHLATLIVAVIENSSVPARFVFVRRNAPLQSPACALRNLVNISRFLRIN